MNQTNQTRLNMVIGYPLQHTRSPQLHNAVYQNLKLDAVLLPFANPDIKALVQVIRTLSVGLTAVTMPFKEKIIKYLDECSFEVQTMKSVNTVIQRDGKLCGYNTDVDGIAYALRNTSLANKRVLIIGAGGAARAVAYVMQKNNAEILWLNRTRRNALKLCATFGGELIDEKQLTNLHIDIIINTTPVGMHPNVDASPLTHYPFQAHQSVFDLVYNPDKTLLLQQAEKAGACVISGLDMFIGQGLRQIELWTGVTIDRQKIGELL